MTTMNYSTDHLSSTPNLLPAINGTEHDWTQEQRYHPISKVIEQYAMPIMCLFGILGNTMASIVFLQKSLRNSSCSIFLAARGISDNGFLSTLLLIWISSTFDMKLSQVRGLCQINIFLTYVCGCLSVWLVVFVTAENCIRICKPFIVNRICKPTIAGVVIGVLCVIIFSFYNFPFWATNPDCIPKLRYIHTINGFIYTDTVITLVLPSVCIIILMVIIITNLISLYNRRGRLSAPTAKRVNNPMAKVTKMLLAVTVTFFCLNLPSHVIRLRLMINSFIAGYPDVSMTEEAIQKITLLMYYLSLSINIIVYLIFGSKFRKVFKDTFFCANSGNGSPHSRHVKHVVPEQFTRNKLHKKLAVLYDGDTNIVTEIEMVPLKRSHRSNTA